MPSTISQFPSAFAALPLGRKAALLVVVAGVIAGTLAVFQWTQQPEFQVLFANLGPEDAAQVTEKLKEQKVPYQLAGSGGTVLVPSGQVYDLRLQLASQGLPQSGGVGFEIFDKGSFGMTEFVQKLNYRRALQGELSRTIGQMAEVERARVHLVVPDRSPFLGPTERARASVALKLRGGKQLTPNQVQGIIHLVSSSVENLPPSQVTVVDTHGQILSRVGEETPVGQLTGGQAEHQRTMERDLEGRVQSMLERVLGPGKAIARVAAQIDFKQSERTEERYDPDGAVVRSEQRQKERSSGSGTVPGGVPGALSNQPRQGGAVLPAGGSSQSSQRQQETVNYEVSKVVSRVVEPVGMLKKLSVAVLVDGRYEMVKGEKGEQRKYTARTDDEMKKYENLVKKAVGFSSERGDQVEVVNVPFETGALAGEEAEPAAEPFWKAWILPAARYGVAVLALLLAYLFVVRPLLRWSTARQPVIEGSYTLPKTVGELEAEMAAALPGQSGMSPKQVTDMARQHPQEAAQLIRRWLKEK